MRSRIADADVKMMLSGATKADVEHIESLLAQLDKHARQLWERIRES
jgi:hypothetical protein